MVQVANEDECGAGLQLSRDGFMIIGASIWTPEMRARNADSGTVLFGCFCDGRHTAQHHGHIAVSRVIVTIDSLAIRNAMLFRDRAIRTRHRDATPVVFLRGSPESQPSMR